MIELFEQNLKEFDRNSSKGNQLKWENAGFWYKADYTGYEGLTEFVVSQLLKFTSLSPDEYVLYELEDIRYKNQIFHGVKSADMLSEDRHMHNIALLMNAKGEYKICPIFDNGGALLSDTRLDYPLGQDVYQLLKDVKAKTISRDFDEQLDAAEHAYGTTIKFYFTHKDVDEILAQVDNYPREVVERVRTIIFEQMRRYSYLFS